MITILSKSQDLTSSWFKVLTGKTHGGEVSTGSLVLVSHKWFSLLLAMDSLREFLETSTIHGLAHISSAPAKLSKVFWLFVVIFGFSFAFYLINDSYNDWQASPIATSISTHPISELDFPTVTVCPPEGPNTALNYDLPYKNQGKH